jgi:hypothetical protein
MKYVFSFLICCLTFIGWSQLDGEYLESFSPVDKLSELANGGGGAEIAGMDQQFFFLISDGSI